MAGTSKSRPADSAIARVAWLIVGVIIGVAVTCGSSGESSANQVGIQRIADQDQVPIGQHGVFNEESDGCPTLDQLDKLAHDSAVHDRGSYYTDFKDAGCVEAEAGDEGINLEFNSTEGANKVRLDKDKQDYWFITIGEDGKGWFNIP